MPAAGWWESWNSTSPQASTPLFDGRTSSATVRPAIRLRKLARDEPSALIRLRTEAAAVPALVARSRREPFRDAGSFGLTGVVTSTPPLPVASDPVLAIFGTFQVPPNCVSLAVNE